MFSGIIENAGRLLEKKISGSNLELKISCAFAGELKPDQSVSHNGVCLTVTEATKDFYKVICIDETLKRSNLGELQNGALINLERSITLQSRLDGHLVQGHVDDTGVCISSEEKNGSHVFTFEYDEKYAPLIIEKGSVCVNGVSLTVVDCMDGKFSVAIIPYTFDHTNFGTIKVGDRVNLEFDVIGKYVARWMELKK